MARHIVSAASSEAGIAGPLQRHVLSFAAKLLAAKEVENKERHFQEVAKGKYARTRVCLTMKTRDLKRFMLRFILRDYGDTHHDQRHITENMGSFITVTHVVSNCFRSSIVTFLACKVTYKIMFLRNVCIK